MDELQKNSLIPVLKDLEHLFDIFNDHFFEGTLKPAVIIASTSGRKNAFGWCTTWKAWTANNKKDIHSLSPTPEELEILNEQDGYYEINLCAEYLNRPFDEVCGTLLHEMVHLYNLQNHIKDTSRGGIYHNSRFREMAEHFGLNVDKDTAHGWCKTELIYESRLFVESLNHDDFDLHRRNMRALPDKKKNNLKKYVCPTCGCIIRASREVEVRCIKCEKRFEYVPPEDEEDPTPLPAEAVGIDPEEVAEVATPPIEEVTNAFTEETEPMGEVS